MAREGKRIFCRLGGPVFVYLKILGYIYHDAEAVGYAWMRRPND